MRFSGARQWGDQYKNAVRHCMRARYVPLVILVSCLTITYQLWKNAEHNALLVRQAEFDYLAQDVAERIRQRMLNYEQVLYGARAFFTNQHDVTHREFHDYITALHLQEKFPGIQGVSFAPLVPRSQKKKHELAMRKDGIVGYVIHPGEERDLYAPVSYIEPETERNLRVLGFDNLSSSVRQVTLETARDHDQAVISEKLQLIQDGDNSYSPGFLMFLPVYRHGTQHDTDVARRAHVTGWLAASFNVADLMAGIVGRDESRLDMELYDAGELSEQRLMYDSDGRISRDWQHLFKTSTQLQVAGHHWLMTVHSLPAYEAGVDRSKANLTAGTGMLISLLLTLLTAVLIRDRARAMQLADGASSELREHKNLQAALFENEQRWKLALEGAGHGVWDWNLLTDEVRCSEQSKQMRGYAADNYPYRFFREWGDGIHPEDRASIMLAIQSHLEGKTPNFIFEYRARCKNGKWKWIVTRGMVIERDANGKPLRMVGTHTDISERKEMEFALRVSEAKLHAILDNAPIGIWLVGVDGRYHFVNKTFCDAIGVAENAFLIAEKLSDVLGPEMAAACVKSDRESLAQDGPHLSHETLTFVDGKPHLMEIRKLPFRDANGETVGVIGIGVDVTDQRAHEEALRESEEKYRALVESALSIILRWDTRGNIVFINRYAEEVFGYQPDELVGKHVVGTIVPETESTSRDLSGLMDDILTHPDKYRLNINENLKKNGERVWVMWTNRPIFDKSGNIIEILSVGYDITDRKRAEEALRESEEKYRELFEFANEFVITSDVEGNVTSANHLVVEALGYSHAEMLAMNLSDFMTPQSLAKAREMTAKKLRGESEVTRYELDLKAKDGRLIPAEFSTRLSYKEGRPAGIHAIGHDISDRLSYEEALRASEERYRSVFDNAQDFIFRLDNANRIVSITSYFSKVTGYSGEEIIGAHIGRFLTPESLEQAQRMVALKLQKGEGITRYEIDVRARDGHLIPVEFNTSLFYKDGMLAGVQGIGRDITERRKHEQALRESEEKYRELFENVGDFAYGTDIDGNFTAVSDSLLAVTGYSREELSGANISKILTSENLALARQMTASKLGGEKQVTRYELVITSKDGRAIPLEIVSSLIFREGKPVGIQGIGRDVSERRQREEALRRSEHNYRELMEDAAEAIFVADPEGKYYVDVNHAACELLGYTREELLRNGFGHIYHPDDPGHSTRFEEMRAGEVLHKKRIFRHKDGHPIPVEVRARMLADGRFHALVRDVSEWLEREAALREANVKAEAASRTKSEFLANMSHEIRTPMNSVIGMTRLALAKEVDTKQRDYLEKILLSGEHLLGIIDDILDFSKIEAGKVKIEATELDIASFMGHLASLVSGKAAAKGLKFTMDIDPALPHNLSGDPLRLRQVLLNFTDNAIKFTDKGLISVSAKLIEADMTSCLLQFEVCDTGIGINASDIPALFQSFQQADGSITRKYGGTGLGLAISKRLVELMGGEIGVESKKAKGSKFWFRVRLERGRQGVMPVMMQGIARQGSQTAIRGARILLAENNLFNQQVASEFLGSAGATVSIANNGSEAIHLLQQAPFDCVLMDVQMPVMDGLEATRQIRADAAYAKMPVIAMTANALHEERERCLAAGMDDFIAKPVLPETLYAILAKWLSPQLPPKAIPDDRSHEVQESAGMGDIDLTVLAEMIGDNQARLREFAGRFLESTRQDMFKVEAALQNQDLAMLRELGHHIKSPARMVGAKSFADLCQALEDNRDDLDKAKCIVSEMNTLLKRIEAQISCFA